MIGIKSFIHHSNNNTLTSKVLFPNLNHVVCWAIIPVLQYKDNRIYINKLHSFKLTWDMLHLNLLTSTVWLYNIPLWELKTNIWAISWTYWIWGIWVNNQGNNFQLMIINMMHEYEVKNKVKTECLGAASHYVSTFIIIFLVTYHFKMQLKEQFLSKKQNLFTGFSFRFIFFFSTTSVVTSQYPSAIWSGWKAKDCLLVVHWKNSLAAPKLELKWNHTFHACMITKYSHTGVYTNLNTDIYKLYIVYSQYTTYLSTWHL